MNLLRLIFLLSICCFLGAARELPLIPAHHPEQIGGRWETMTPSGIKGLGFEIYSQSAGAPGHFVLQQVNVRVYTREGGKEKGGYFAAQYGVKPVPSLLPYPTSFEVFDGRHLRMDFTGASDTTPFDLDIFFSPKASAWIGTWSRNGKAERVTLTRPKVNNGAERNKLVGEWIGQPSPDNSYTATTINIRQSADGVLYAWLDQTSCPIQKNGYQLNIESVLDSAVVLKTNNSTFGNNKFRGSLSADGQKLNGKWDRPGECCGTPGGSEQFRRAPVVRE